MTTRPFLRVLSALLVAGLFAAATPATPAEASRPVCRTLRSVKVKVPVQRYRIAHPSIGAKVCYSGGVLQVELRQKNLASGSAHPEERVAPAIDGLLDIVVHSTSSKGRYLNQIVHSEEVWLGNVSDSFSTGTATDGGVVIYNPTAPRFVYNSLPTLQPGIYQISFELSLSPTENPAGKVTTRKTYLKVKVS
jgi:hypothetical protein